MYQRILVPIDGSKTSRHGLGEAIKLARLTQGQLRLVHVIDELSMAYGMEGYAAYGGGDWIGVLRSNAVQIVDDALATVRRAGIPVDSVLHDSFAGIVHELVIAEAIQWKAEVIVLGTHGRRGIRRLLLGSSAENILRYAPVPVLLLRAPEVSEVAASFAETSRLDAPPAAAALQ